jgi:hypothetical protein
LPADADADDADNAVAFEPNPESTSRYLAPSLPRLRFHDLRHAHATHLLANGVHPKVASERLGHSKVGITLDLYSHVIPGMQEDAAAVVDTALKAARKHEPDSNGSNPVAGRVGGMESE